MKKLFLIILACASTIFANQNHHHQPASSQPTTSLRSKIIITVLAISLILCSVNNYQYRIENNELRNANNIEVENTIQERLKTTKLQNNFSLLGIDLTNAIAERDANKQRASQLQEDLLKIRETHSGCEETLKECQANLRSANKRVEFFLNNTPKLQHRIKKQKKAIQDLLTERLKFNGTDKNVFIDVASDEEDKFTTEDDANIAEQHSSLLVRTTSFLANAFLPTAEPSTQETQP